MQRQRQSIVLFKLFTFWFWFANYILNPYMSPYAKQLGASNVVIGFVVSAYSVAQIILKIPIGIGADRIGKKKIFIVVGAAITFIAEIGMFLSASVGGLIVFRLLQGIAVASWVCATVLFASYLPADQAVNATVELQICNSAGTLTGYFLGGFVTSRYGYHSVFLIAALGALVAFVVSLFISEECGKSETNSVGLVQLINVGKTPFLLFVTGVCLIGQMILATTTWGFTPTLAVEMGADSMQVSIISICSSVPGLLCSLFVSRRLVKRWGEKRVVVLATAMEALFCCTQALMPSVALLAINCVLSGFFHAMSYSVLLGLSIKYFSARVRAAAMGFMQSFYCIGLFVGPVISGYFNDLYGMRAGFVAIGLIGFVAPVITVLLYDCTERRIIAQQQDDR